MLACSTAGPCRLGLSSQQHRQHRALARAFRHNHSCSRRRALLVRAQQGDPAGAQEALQQAGKSVSNLVKGVGQLVEDIVDDNVLQYCSLDPTGKPIGKRSLGEKEQDFLNALASFYYDGQPVMSNEEFDNLKEELIWEGSKVAVLSAAEQRFMEASMAYTDGKGYLSDDEYDELKKELREQNSKVVQQGPRCSLRTRTMYSDAQPDYVKITALNIPNVVLVLLCLFAFDDFTGFKVTQLLELPQPWSIIIVWGFVLPAVFLAATALTNFVLKDALILKGPCPSCGVEASTYFGDILTVRGNREKNTVTCENCKAKMDFLAPKRQIIVQNDPDEGTGKKKAAKKSAGEQPKKPAQKKASAEPQPA